MKEKRSKENSIEYAFIKEITSLFPSQIVKIIFFGSRAKEIFKPSSDYDFLIVLKDKRNKIIDEIYDVVTNFLIKHGVDISLKIYREEDFKRMASIPTPFMNSILKTGKELWTQKPKN